MKEILKTRMALRVGGCICFFLMTAAVAVGQVQSPPPPCLGGETALRAIRLFSGTIWKRGELKDATLRDSCFYVIDHESGVLPRRGILTYGLEFDFEIEIPAGGAVNLSFPQHFLHTGGKIWAEFELRRKDGSWDSLGIATSQSGAVHWKPKTINNPTDYYRDAPGPDRAGYAWVEARVSLFNGGIDPTTPMPCEETKWDQGGGKGN